MSSGAMATLNFGHAKLQMVWIAADSGRIYRLATLDGLIVYLRGGGLAAIDALFVPNRSGPDDARHKTTVVAVRGL